MGIDLKQLDTFGLSKEFQIRVLFQDRDRNGRLESTDMALAFGTTSAARHSNALEEAVRNNNPQAFDAALEQLSQTRSQALRDTFVAEAAPTLRAFRQERDGVYVADDAFHFVKASSYAGPPKNVCDKIANALVGPFRKAIQKEFSASSGMLSYAAGDWLYGNLSSAFCFQTDASIGEVVSYLVERFFPAKTWVYSAVDVYFPSPMAIQQDYAETQYNEFRQSDAMTQFEQRSQLDIRVLGDGALTNEQIVILDGVLRALEQKRPKDRALLTTLILRLSNVRGEGRCFLPNTIRIIGPFGTPRGFPLHDRYSEEHERVRKSGTHESFFMMILAHELGHLVAYRDTQTPTRFFSPEGYRAVLSTSDETDIHEWFAEDYGLYLVSNGTAIARKTVGGKEIPNYEKRLAYMREHYPVITNQRRSYAETFYNRPYSMHVHDDRRLGNRGGSAAGSGGP